MTPFTTHTGRVATLDRVNVDTDQIIPKQYLKTIHRTGLKEGLFADWRRLPDGSPDPDFFMNQPRSADATILLTRENFGCGSSREHAPWALLDYGIRSLLAPSFADIFYNNCLQNGLLPIVLTAQDVQALFDYVGANPQGQLTIDLPSQTVSTLQASGEPAPSVMLSDAPALNLEGKNLTFSFSIDAFRKNCLLQGLDSIGLTLQREKDIEQYVSRRKQEVPWLFQDLCS